MDSKLKKTLRFAADNLIVVSGEPEAAEAVLKAIETIEKLEQQLVKVAIASLDVRKDLKHGLHAAEVLCEALKIPK